MSGKKSRGSPSNDESPPRPIALLVAVVFAAAVSTWHWYRPLPPRATTVSNGPFVSQSEALIAKESPRFKSKWKDSGLIFPSGDDPPVEPKSDPVTFATPSSEKSNRDSDAASIESLTGNSELALQPFRETSQPIHQSISRMPLPMVPVKSTEESSPPSPSESRLWTAAKRTQDPAADKVPDTEDAELENRNSDTFAESASPFRVPRIERDVRASGPIVALKSEIWPDQGFDPKRVVSIGQQRNSSPTTTPSSESPGRMSLSSNRIRTSEQEPTALSTAANTSVPNPLRTQDAPKKGIVIRQPTPSKPTPKTQVTK